jgi:hypothetical protein
VLQIHLPLLDQVLVHLLGLLPPRASQAPTVRSSSPKAATIAWVGQPWQTNVSTTVTRSAALRSR